MKKSKLMLALLASFMSVAVVQAQNAPSGPQNVQQLQDLLRAASEARKQGGASVDNSNLYGRTDGGTTGGGATGGVGGGSGGGMPTGGSGDGVIGGGPGTGGSGSSGSGGSTGGTGGVIAGGGVGGGGSGSGGSGNGPGAGGDAARGSGSDDGGSSRGDSGWGGGNSDSSNGWGSQEDGYGNVDDSWSDGNGGGEGAQGAAKWSGSASDFAAQFPMNSAESQFLNQLKLELANMAAEAGMSDAQIGNVLAMATEDYNQARMEALQDAAMAGVNPLPAFTAFEAKRSRKEIAFHIMRTEPSIRSISHAGEVLYASKFTANESLTWSKEFCQPSAAKAKFAWCKIPG